MFFFSSSAIPQIQTLVCKSFPQKYREKVVPINLENEGFDSRCVVIHLIFAEPLNPLATHGFSTQSHQIAAPFFHR